MKQYPLFLKKHYPLAYQHLSQNNVSVPFFEESIALPHRHYLEIQKVVSSLYQLKEDPLYQKSLLSAEKLSGTSCFQSRYSHNHFQTTHNKGLSCSSGPPLAGCDKKAFVAVPSRGNPPSPPYQGGSLKPNFERDLKPAENFERGLKQADSSNIKSLIFPESHEKQNSVLMAYDFHLSDEGVKLIEVNTNASGFLLLNSLYQFHNWEYQQALESLKDSFKKEWEIFHARALTPKGLLVDESPQQAVSRWKFCGPDCPKVLLVDEQPQQQKMFLEFLLFKDFFLSMGWDMEVVDSKNLESFWNNFLNYPPDKGAQGGSHKDHHSHKSFRMAPGNPLSHKDHHSHKDRHSRESGNPKKPTDDLYRSDLSFPGYRHSRESGNPDKPPEFSNKTSINQSRTNKQGLFIYNRLTDFYFKNHPLLAHVYNKGMALINPQPKDYFLLADKKRLWDFQNRAQLQSIKKHLLKVQLLSEDNKEELWKDRKKYFFKIRQGYAGKLAYRGASLSHKKYKELLQYPSIAQEYAPPSTVKDSKGQEWKVDFRAYVYKDQIQQIGARVYQGQLTQFRTPGSGFALVKIV